MTTLEPELAGLLACAAEYPALGCQWSVVAARLALPQDDLVALVEEAGEEFEKRVAWVAADLEREREARAFAELKRNLHNAATDASELRAAERLAAGALRFIRAELIARRQRRERREKLI